MGFAHGAQITEPNPVGAPPHGLQNLSNSLQFEKIPLLILFCKSGAAPGVVGKSVVSREDRSGKSVPGSLTASAQNSSRSLATSTRPEKFFITSAT